VAIKQLCNFGAPPGQFGARQMGVRAFVDNIVNFPTKSIQSGNRLPFDRG
jgi:hypothetical protein